MPKLPGIDHLIAVKALENVVFASQGRVST